MNARKAHNSGRNHVANVRDYFASLGHDTAQNIIDAIIQQHESGGRAQMLAAPSMRLGAGFMNPMAPPMNYPPFPATAAGPYPPQSAPAPPFRSPFPPTGSPLPPFPASSPNPMPNGMPPFPMPQQQANGGLPPNQQPTFTPAAGPPEKGNPGIHPDRLRMMGM